MPSLRTLGNWPEMAWPWTIMVLDPGLMFRAGTEQDRAYIADSIRHSLRGQPYSKDLSNAAISLLIDPLLASCKVLCLAPVDDPGSIISFLAYSGTDRIIWIQSRDGFRRRGYAGALFEAAGIRPGQIKCSLIVYSWDGGGNFPKWAETKGYKLRFRPWDVLEIMASTHG